MALYAIGDLHLSMTSDKPMDVFGARWENHVEKLREGFSALTEDDVCVLCGDLSWGMSIVDCLDDFRFIASLPGRKIVLKGNHDYWWTTRAKAERFFAENGIEGIEILNNNCVMYDEKTAICGTRGWFYEEETGAAHDRKIMDREIGRLETSLKAAGDAEKLCFLHYPPIFRDYICREMLDMLAAYGVRRCFYGHIHGIGHKFAFEGLRGGVDYRLVSADYVDFRPVRVL